MYQLILMQYAYFTFKKICYYLPHLFAKVEGNNPSNPALQTAIIPTFSKTLPPMSLAGPRPMDNSKHRSPKRPQVGVGWFRVMIQGHQISFKQEEKTLHNELFVLESYTLKK